MPHLRAFALSMNTPLLASMLNLGKVEIPYDE